MYTSRFFHYTVKTLRTVGTWGGMVFVSVLAQQKYYEDFQKKHPGAVIHQHFQPVPIFGGYLKLSAGKELIKKDNNLPECK